MPLNQNLVEAGKNSFGDTAIFCAHCHKQADYTQTIDKDEKPIFELMCPTPDPKARTLGSWDSEKQRADDIRKFLEGAAIHKHVEETRRSSN